MLTIYGIRDIGEHFQDNQPRTDYLAHIRKYLQLQDPSLTTNADSEKNQMSTTEIRNNYLKNLTSK